MGGLSGYEIMHMRGQTGRRATGANSGTTLDNAGDTQNGSVSMPGVEPVGRALSRCVVPQLA